MLEKRQEDIQEAVGKIVEGRLTVWNARLELAMRVGDVQKIDSLLAHSPVADGNGCDWSCGGGALFRQPESVALPERT